MTNGDKRIALLIDADNAPAAKIDVILTEVARHGSANVRRAYGDWESSNLKRWKAKLAEHSIEAVQQSAYTQGKNATDMRMVIGAMDLLRDESVDAFALVSSDADFTPLVTRLREAAHEVYGFGEEKTPKPFRAACTQFTVVPGQVKPSKLKPWVKHSSGLVAPGPPAGGKQKLCADPAFHLALRTAVVATKAKSGWANLGQVRNEIGNQRFELRGSGKFSKLIASTGLFEIRRVGLVAQVRVKPQT
jgi:uncharacterized protein (TIGR00288 family)